MANYKEDIVDVELESGVLHRSFLNYTIGAGDSNANRFGVRVFRNGKPESLSGISCSGYFRNNRDDVFSLSGYGSVSGNVAYVTLPASCYREEGAFYLSIKLAGGGRNTTVRIVEGTVIKTSQEEAVLPDDAPEYYEDFKSENYTTSGTYRNSGIVYDDLTIQAGHFYRFEVTNDYAGSNKGYLYLMDGNTQVNAIAIPSDRRNFAYEWIPQNDYTIDVIVGWDATGVNGTVKFYEELVPIQLVLNSLIKEGEAWV